MTSLEATTPPRAPGLSPLEPEKLRRSGTRPQDGYPAWIALTFAGMCTSVVLTGATAQWLWVGELAVHWSGHAAIGLLPALMIWRRRPRYAVPLMALIVVAALPVLRSAMEPRLSDVTGPTTSITVAFANVYDFNRERPRALQAIVALDADVVGLAEVSIHDRPQAASPRWPFQHWEDHAGVLSVALLSVHPIMATTLHDVAGAGVLDATLDLGHERHLRVIVAHLFSPKDGTAERRRNDQLAFLARLTATESGPLLVLGDLNISSASPHWRTFICDSGLRCAEGLSPATWPTILGPGGIGIDHLLARGLGLTGVSPFPIPGSDHRGLHATAHLGITGDG